MIIYRDVERQAESSVWLESISRELLDAQRGNPNHDRIVEILIETAELESAVVDYLSPEYDFLSPITRRLRTASIATGRVLCASWCGTGGVRGAVSDASAAFARLATCTFPRSVRVRVSEGFAYYGLFPETYIEAAARFHDEQSPTSVVCLGIRSIGTALSAVVTAALELRGCAVLSYTVRPHGHPFDRRLHLAHEMGVEIRSGGASHFLVVDEGPGLSGSTMTCVARKLTELGIPAARIILFPSWNPEPDALCNDVARSSWKAYRKYTFAFEQAADRPGGAWHAIGAGDRDVSAGRWRELAFASERDYPAVQPQHERRKYLRQVDGRRTLIKFAGLGRYGRTTLQRAEQLTTAGFSPPMGDLVNGFINYDFIDGAPLQASDARPAFIEAAAGYAAVLRQLFPGDRAAPFEEDLDMIRVNTREGLGAEWEPALTRLEKYRKIVISSPTTAVDGRMLPHEWLLTSNGYLKTDATDHHNDHFFPGCQDIAWDIAGTCIEFRLDTGSCNRLVEVYSEVARDPSIRRRLPFYRIAYCAYRLGYATVAVQAIPASSDAARFRDLARHYARCLRSELRAQDQ